MQPKLKNKPVADCPMNAFFSRSLPLLFCTLFFVTCKKEAAPETEDPSNNGPVAAGSFSWKAGSGATVTADSAYYYSQFTTIYAFKNGLSNSLEVNLSALSAGSYSLSSATGNMLTFITNATTYTASSGSFNITGTANNKLTGNFTAAFSGGTLTSLSGEFDAIPHR
jgi:hypothetical protein